MDLSLVVKFIVLLFIGAGMSFVSAYFIHSGRQIRARNRRGEELQRQWDALNIKLGGGEVVLDENQQLKLIATEPKLVEKFVRMEALSIALGKLLGHSIFTLQKSLEHPKGKWILGADWANYGLGLGHDEVTYVTLRERVKGWARYKWVVAMQYQRYYKHGSREEKRYLFTFQDHVVAELDKLSDELEEQIARASRATEEHREQFRLAVEEHPREEKNRFDQIDPIP